MAPDSPQVPSSGRAWSSIRLELATTGEFPRGSASRAYMLRLPLGLDDAIDEATMRDMPARATVRRFWPSQADLSGHVITTPAGWAFVYDCGEPILQPMPPALRLGKDVLLVEPDGSRLPFRIVSVLRLN
ncbi:MAG: hypothetical protein LBV50_10450 [Novosphingobium sp.]|jgi:hypothetical protein|nr:hypothetical protein [Novosphingobium sp.]